MKRPIIALFWLVLSVFWVVVIFVTDQPAWPLAIWVATSVGPMTRWASRASNSAS